MSEGWELCTSNTTIMIATWRQVVMTRFQGTSTVADIDALRRVSADLARKYPEGIAHLNDIDVIRGTQGTIDDDVRAALVRLLGDPAVRLRASAVVYPGAGFGAAFVRSLLGGLVLLTRTRATIRFHDSLEAGARWLAETMVAVGAGPLPPADLIRIARSFRAPDAPARAAGT